MCSHDWRKVNDVWVCIRCGITRTPSGVIFDRRIANYKAKKKKKGKRGKKR